MQLNLPKQLITTNLLQRPTKTANRP